MKPKIKVDWDMLEMSFTMNTVEMKIFLDIETGELRHYPGWGDAILTDEDLDAGGDRYIEIEPPESSESYRWMERFAGSVENDRIREKLFVALDRRKPFRRFKDALGEFPDLLEEWYLFEDRCRKAHIAEWISSLDVEFLDPPAWLVDIRKKNESDEEDRTASPKDPKARLLTWQDICLSCRKYYEHDRPPDNDPLAKSSGLTEGDLCRMNRDDQADSREDFECGAYVPKEID